MFEPFPYPADQPRANNSPTLPTLIEGVVPPPQVLSLRSKGVLDRMCTREQLSAREISRLAGASRSGVLKALNRFSIPRDQDRPTRIGPLPFGLGHLNHQLVRNDAEQAAIRMMWKCRLGGLSLREIAGALNMQLIPTKQNGLWQANTVQGILARA